MFVAPGLVAVRTPVVTLLAMTCRSVLMKVMVPTVEVMSQGLVVEQPGDGGVVDGGGVSGCSAHAYASRNGVHHDAVGLQMNVDLRGVA